MAADVSSTADRLQFGLISGTFGVVVGAFAALAVLAIFALVGHPHHFNRSMVAFSGAFFFLVGAVRGSESAETVVDSFVAALAVVLGALGIAEGAGAFMPGDPSWRSSLWWTVAYFAGMVSLACFA